MALKQGGAGADILHGTDNDDFMLGYGGNDILKGFGGNDVLNGGAGVDWMSGGAGDDTYYVDNVNDDVVEGAGEGYDRVFASTSYSILGQDDIEELRLLNAAGNSSAEGNSSNNTLVGNASANTLMGYGGNDMLDGGASADVLLGGEGDDTMLGGAGVDVLTGGVGRDAMSGGADLDFFIFHDTVETGLTEGTADAITDFSIADGDRINVGAIDADVYADGNQAFTFIGQAAFSGTPGEINYYHAGGNTYIQLQTGMSADVEGVIRLDGIHNPEAGWFIL
jgi:Ca2+-binding RTX toxin-like protein